MSDVSKVLCTEYNNFSGTHVRGVKRNTHNVAFEQVMIGLLVGHMVWISFHRTRDARPFLLVPKQFMVAFCVENSPSINHLVEFGSQSTV